MPYYPPGLPIRHRALEGIVCAIALAASGCAPEAPGAGEPDGGAPRAAEPPFASPLIGEPAPPEPDLVLELVDPGREPRRPLRYGAGPGTRQRLRMKMRGGNEIFIGGRRALSQQDAVTDVWFSTEVEAAHGDRLDCQIRFDRAETIDWERFAPGRAHEYRRAVAGLDGQRYRFTADRRGFVELPPLELAPDRDSDRDVVRATLESSVRSLVVLPAEPVGVGARWRTIEDDRGRMYFLSGRVRSEVELVAVRGRRIELSMSRSFDLPSQPVPQDRPLVLGFHGIQLESSGRAVIDLDLLHPVEMEGKVEYQIDGTQMQLTEQTPLRVVGNGVETLGAW